MEEEILDLHLEWKNGHPLSSVRSPSRGDVNIATYVEVDFTVNLLKPTGYVMHQQFNIQQLYVLPTLYLCVLFLSENKLRIVPLTA